MSDTYDIACHDCKERVWVGRGGASPWTLPSWTLYGEPETMQAVCLFLWNHKGHRLEFNETQLDAAQSSSPVPDK